jgi:hypothetical protein
MGEAIRHFLSEISQSAYFAFFRKKERREPEHVVHVDGLRIDYSDIPADEWRAADPAMADLIERSRPVSPKREL